ncbi:MAG: ribose 5-phosphate isomerase B [Rikenellaceae bacterium]
MKVGIAADHAGYQMKEFVLGYLSSLGHEVYDFGTLSEESVDYPDFAHPLAEAVEKKEVELGFAFCGSANGISMTLNKHQGVRAAICWLAEIATLAREHNDANICSMPARYISNELAIEITDAFLAANFEGGRHIARVNKIACS